MLVKDKIESVGQWRDDLCWCPSQCYLTLRYKTYLFVLYLRWRWNDPWQVTVVYTACTEPDMHAPSAVWHRMDVGSFKADELPNLKEKALKEAKKFIYKTY